MLILLAVYAIVYVNGSPHCTATLTLPLLALLEAKTSPISNLISIQQRQHGFRGTSNILDITQM